jgi:hypothetical protein
LDGHDWHLLRGRNGWSVAFVEKSDLRGLPGILPKNLDGLAPGGFLTAVEFAEVEHLPLKHVSARDPAFFDHTPVEVLFAILAASFTAEEHAQ